MNNRRTFAIVSSIFFLLAPLTSVVAVRDDGEAGNGGNVTLINPLGTGSCDADSNCLVDFLLKILRFVNQVGVVVVILMIVYVGFLFVTARGEPAKISAAREAFLWTVIGALILLGSEAIAIAIQATVEALAV